MKFVGISCSFAQKLDHLWPPVDYIALSMVARQDDLRLLQILALFHIGLQTLFYIDFTRVWAEECDRIRLCTLHLRAWPLERLLLLRFHGHGLFLALEELVNLRIISTLRNLEGFISSDIL